MLEMKIDSRENYLSKIRMFVEGELDPISTEVDESDQVPLSVIKKMAGLGLVGISVPKKYGGHGLNNLEACKLAEIMGRTNHCFLRMLGWGCIDILLEGTEKQIKKYLPPQMSGELINAYALSEPQAGSDSSNISTTARRSDNGFLLNGQKIMVSRGYSAGLFILFALTDESKRAHGGITCFIVEDMFPGFRKGKKLGKMGLRGMDVCDIYLENCEVPGNNVLGGIGEGFRVAMRGLDTVRLKVIAAPSVGQAQKLLELSIKYAKKRIQFGKALSENQAIQFMLADMAVSIYASRVMIYDTAQKADKGERITSESAMAKMFSSEMLCRVADMALQIQGGIGYMKGNFIEIAYRDARLGKIWDGTNEIQKIVISRKLLKEEK